MRLYSNTFLIKYSYLLNCQYPEGFIANMIIFETDPKQYVKCLFWQIINKIFYDLI